MNKPDCIFCKIVSGQIPCAKFFENEKFIVILNLFPNTKGASLVIPKEHVGSDVLNLNENDFKVVHQALDTAKIAAQMLKNAFKPNRVVLVTEGFFVDHLHIKLYPVYLSGDKGQGFGKQIPVYFEKFPGYVSTQDGPQLTSEAMAGLVGEILNCA